jgi:hypothetical protein
MLPFLSREKFHPLTYIFISNKNTYKFIYFYLITNNKIEYMGLETRSATRLEVVKDRKKKERKETLETRRCISR